MTTFTSLQYYRGCVFAAAINKDVFLLHSSNTQIVSHDIKHFCDQDLVFVKPNCCHLHTLFCWKYSVSCWTWDRLNLANTRLRFSSQAKQYVDKLIRPLNNDFLRIAFSSKQFVMLATTKVDLYDLETIQDIKNSVTIHRWSLSLVSSSEHSTFMFQLPVLLRIGCVSGRLC